MTTVLDLDQPAASKPPPRWRARIPWVLFGVALAALVASLAARIPVAPAEPSIDYSGNGWARDLHVTRGPDGRVEAVVLVVSPMGGDQPARCRLVVDGQEVTDEGHTRHPAVCIWVAG